MICIDERLVSKYGWNAALLVERLFFLLHSTKCNHPQFVEDEHGRRWWDSSAHDKRLDALLHQFKVDGELLMSRRTLQSTLAKLSPPIEGEDAAPCLLDVVHTHASIRIAINFDGLREAVGKAAFERYVKLMPIEGEKVAPSDDDEGEDVAPPNNEDEGTASYDEPHNDAETGQGEDVAPSNDEGEEAAPLSYIEESFDESLKETQAAIAPPNSPYQGIFRMCQAFMPEFDRQAIGSMLGVIQNGQKQSLFIDARATDMFAVYYMLHPKGALWKERFPEDAGEFIAAFRNYLRWQESESHQRELQAICDQFPDWRTRLFTGDYTALQEAAKAWHDSLKPSHRKGSPFTRTDSERRRAGHKPDLEARRRLP